MCCPCNSGVPGCSWSWANFLSWHDPGSHPPSLLWSPPPLVGPPHCWCLLHLTGQGCSRAEKKAPSQSLCLEVMHNFCSCLIHRISDMAIHRCKEAGIQARLCLGSHSFSTSRWGAWHFLGNKLISATVEIMNVFGKFVLKGRKMIGSKLGRGEGLRHSFFTSGRLVHVFKP